MPSPVDLMKVFAHSRGFQGFRGIHGDNEQYRAIVTAQRNGNFLASKPCSLSRKTKQRLNVMMRPSFCLHVDSAE